MITEVKFGSPVKLGKTLCQSWHKTEKASSGRFEVTKEGTEFLFSDSQGEFKSVLVSWTNIQYCVVDAAKKVAKNGKKDDAKEA